MIHDIYPIPLMTPSFRLDLISRFNTTPCQDHLQDRIRGPNPQKERKSRTDDLVQGGVHLVTKPLFLLL